MKTYQPLCNVIAGLLSDETLNADSYDSLAVSLTEAQNDHPFSSEQEARLIFPLVLQHIFGESPVSLHVQIDQHLYTNGRYNGTTIKTPLASFTDELPKAFERVFDVMEIIQQTIPITQDDFVAQGNSDKVKAINVLLVSADDPRLNLCIYRKLFTEEYVTVEEIVELFKAVQ